MQKVNNQHIKELAKLENDILMQISDKGVALLEVIYNRNQASPDFIIDDVNQAFLDFFNIDSKGGILNKSLSEFTNYNSVDFLSSVKNTYKTHTKTSIHWQKQPNEKTFEIEIIPVNQEKMALVYTDVTEIENIKQTNIRLKQIIKAISIINGLIINEKEIDSLLNRACETIANLPYYDLAWITTFHKNTTSLNSFYCSDKHVLSTYEKHSPVFSCINEITQKGTPYVFYNPMEECINCKLEEKFKANSHLVFPMVFNDFKYGILCVSVKNSFAFDPCENEVFNNLARDLAHAIFNFEVKHDLELARQKVRDYYHEIDNQNKKFKSLNAELELKNKALEKVSSKAIESEKLKATFLANISHEIRTPLNGILGFTQLIKATKYSQEKINEYIDIISISGNLLMETIDNILDISKLESGQLELHKTQCNINLLLDEIIQLNKINVLKREEVELISNIGRLSKGYDLYTDGEKLKQVLNILIQNAFKFTEEGFIEVGVTEQNDSLIFYVQDTGIGIEEDKFNMIFENFRQVDETSTRKFGGIGLGLSIAKGIVNLLGGEIWLSSKTKTKFNSEIGTTFYLRLPYQVNSEIETTQIEMDLDKIETIDWEGKKILIVEDDAFSAEYLTEALESTKVQLYYAKSGNEAINKVKEIKDLNLVLMDIQLPGLSGDKATMAIREFNPEIPIIAQTAHAMINDKENYIKAGCSDYISKPIAINDLFSILCKYL